MIEVRCDRNKSGLYVFDKIDRSKHRVVMNSFSEKKNSENFWCYPEYGIPFLVKYRKYPAYIFALYSELLFSGACKQNGIECANIDVGTFKGYPCVLSQDVSFGADEKINAYGLATLAGIEAEELYYNKEKTYREGFFADRLFNYANLAKDRFSELEIDKNFLLDLYKMAFIDLMFAQEDRNPTNIMFLLKKNGEKRTLSVAPLFDNEYSFEFMRLCAFYLHNGLDPVEVMNDPVQNLGIGAMFSADCGEVAKYATPIFGTKFMVKRFRFPLGLSISENKAEPYRRCAGRILKREYENMVSIILSNPEMKKFVDNFKVDMFKVAEDVKAKQNFNIPEDCTVLAQEIFEYNYKRLQRQFKKVQKNTIEEKEEEKGD